MHHAVELVRRDRPGIERLVVNQPLGAFHIDVALQRAEQQFDQVIAQDFDVGVVDETAGRRRLGVAGQLVAVGDVEFIFGDSIVGLDDRGDAVAVSFERADARDFDLVVEPTDCIPTCAG